MMAGIFGRAIRWQCALALGALAFAAAQSAAADVADRLLADARDGQLDSIDFFTAALVAGGTTDECELSGWVDAYIERRAQVLGTLREAPAKRRLQAIHEALHEQILTGHYETTASDPRRALASGEFNCLSALAIYWDLCQAAGIDVQICLVRGHVYLRPAAEGQSLTIEPATPQWLGTFAPRRAGPRTITPIQLLGKFYYNRGVELLQSRRYAEGIELLAVSLELDGNDADARANLVAGLNNWAVEHLVSGRYDDAAELIEQGLTLDPGFAPLVANQQLVRSKRAGR